MVIDEQCSGCPHDPHAIRCFRFKPGRHRMEQCPCKERMNAGFTTPAAGGSRRDSPLRAVVEVPVREFDFADVAEMQQEMKQDA